MYDIKSKNFTSLSDMMSYIPTISLTDTIQDYTEDTCYLSTIMNDIFLSLWEEVEYENYYHIDFAGPLSRIFTSSVYNFRYSLNGLIRDVKERKPRNNSPSYMGYYFR